MTGLEYTDRLIDDINKIIIASTQVQNPFSEMAESEIINFANITKSLNISESLLLLEKLIEFINKDNSNLVNYKKGDLPDFNKWHKDVLYNRIKIAELFQQKIDNKEPSEVLIEQLNSIHNTLNKPLY